MTLTSTPARISYVGTGSVDTYAVPFKFHADDELGVYTSDLSGDETLLILGVDYTVTGAGQPSGGSITLLAGNLAVDWTLVIIRDVPQDQQTDYVELDNFPADSHETALDKLTMLVQQLQEEVDRCIQATVTSPNIVEIVYSESNEIAEYDGTGKIHPSGATISQFAFKDVPGQWLKAQVSVEQILAYSANIVWDLDEIQHANLQLAGNAVIESPLNMRPGGIYILDIRQDGVGNHTLTWNTAFQWEGGTPPNLALGPLERTIISFFSSADQMFGGLFWRES